MSGDDEVTLEPGTTQTPLPSVPTHSPNDPRATSEH